MGQKIILIGPISAGKTTIGELLSKRLKLEWVQLDEIRWPYYDEIGYDNEVTKQRHEQGGIEAVVNYWKPFEAHSVERVLADYDDCVIDFGGGQSVYEDEVLFARVQKALEPYPNVVLLLPSPDLDESVKILNSRIPLDDPNILPFLYQLNTHFVKHPSNLTLAKITVYTNGRTPDQTCDDIIERLK
ncbi:MAG: shikimate kinase [Chloroflexi bacterium]|nr:shikimate kinase [Chloroflexota bacterium]MCC6893819.1 shikimate kinase [Anaerolineae bacterium]